MPKDDLVYIGHMLDTARKVAEKVQGIRRTDFDKDENLRIALAHLIQVIGEAARHVSPAFRDAHPEVPWPAIVGMRHKVVHDYMNVDENVVWKTATEEMTQLISQFTPLVPPQENTV
ncbi:MAG: DUF86 domain-containing protein [Planctomycetota bacterium]|nr:DUF86 domain-containing protein [Planctomycetota bacterium]